MVKLWPYYGKRLDTPPFDVLIKFFPHSYPQTMWTKQPGYRPASEWLHLMTHFTPSPLAKSAIVRLHATLPPQQKYCRKNCSSRDTCTALCLFRLFAAGRRRLQSDSRQPGARAVRQPVPDRRCARPRRNQ